MNARDDDGFVTAEWIAGVAMLVLPMILIVSALPAWAARHEAAAAAAREGARVAVASGSLDQATLVARAAVTRALHARGLTPDGVGVRVVGDHLADGALARHGEVTVTVTIPSGVLTIPLIGTVDGPVVAGSHTRRLDPHRSR